MHHKDLLEALYQVSFVGAGLTYSTIFRYLYICAMCPRVAEYVQYQRHQRD